MNKPTSILVVATLLAAPAVANVRPENCAPVFPLMDKVAAAAPADVQVAQAAPAAAAKRGFFGLPLLLPLLAVGGGAALLSGGGGGGGDNPVSPA